VLADLFAKLEARGLKLACAESLTGGLLASTIVNQSGASKVFLGGVIAYDTNIKRTLLGVDSDLLDERGPVDPRVALEMALGVRRALAKGSFTSEASIVGIATTGVAGPDNQDGKPVGLVYLAIAGLGEPELLELNLAGDRNTIRESAVSAALEALSARL